MNRVLIQLIYFVIYSIVFLIIGKLSFSESDSLSKFFVGERKNDEKRLFFTFVGTWVSAATILGFTGNVYHSGLSVIASSVIPWFIGAGLLYLMTDRLYENDVLSIPQLIGKKHHSKFLQTVSAIFMICGYIFYLMIQIKGFGIAVSSLLNINYKVAVFLVYLFILYSSFGGFNSVTKSDCLNLIMLSVSIGVLYLIIVKNVPGHWVLTDQTVHELIKSKGVFEKQTAEIGIFVYISMFFGWGMGLASNPQYMVRILAAKDKKTAKHMILHALIFLCVLYFALTQIGLGLRILFPQLKNYCSADDVFIYAVVNLMNTPFSGFFLISVIGACVSTANSQLHLIGCIRMTVADCKWIYDHCPSGTVVTVGDNLPAHKKEDVGGADSHPGAGMYLHGRHGCTDLIRKSAEGHAVLRGGYLGIILGGACPSDLRGTVLETENESRGGGSVLYGTYLLCPVLENGSPDILGISGNTVRGGSLCCDPDV